jgi:hypothetical protein
MTRVQDEFRKLGEIRGGVLMLSPENAVKMVQRCRKRQIRILGIDGFLLSNRATRPVMEESIDLSRWQNDAPSCWDLAKNFLEQRKSTELHFEVVLDE